MASEVQTTPSVSQASATQSPIPDTTQQATAQPISAPPPKREKNPNRVAAGKRVAERTRIAREQQKKAAAEAEIIISNSKNNSKAPKNGNSVANVEPPIAEEKDESSSKGFLSALSTNQLLTVISIGVSLLGVYYYRQSILQRAAPQTTTPTQFPSEQVQVGDANPQPAQSSLIPRRVRNMD